MPPRPPGLRIERRPGRASWYIVGTVNGKRIRESAETDDEALAREKAAARHTELFRAAIYGVAPTVTFAAAALSYLQADKRTQGTKDRVARLVKHWGPKTACSDIKQAEIDKAARVICRATSSPATRLREVTSPAKAILTHAARRGWCPLPIFESAPASGRRTDWIRPDEAHRLVEAAPAFIRPLLIFGLCTGARANEMFRLDWSDVDLQYGRATFRDTKSGADRIAALPPRAVATLANLPHREGRVFRDRRGQPFRDTNEDRDGDEAAPHGGQIRSVFNTAVKAARIGRPLSPHHMRHTWATWHYCAHKDLVLLQEEGGWGDITMVRRYAKLAPDGMRTAIMAFWASNPLVTSSADRRMA